MAGNERLHVLLVESDALINSEFLLTEQVEKFGFADITGTSEVSPGVVDTMNKFGMNAAVVHLAQRDFYEPIVEIFEHNIPLIVTFTTNKFPELNAALKGMGVPMEKKCDDAGFLDIVFDRLCELVEDRSS